MSQQIHAIDGMNITRLLFNGWIWSTNEAASAQNRRSALLNEVFLRVVELEIQIKVDKRSDSEWTTIYNRRVCVNIAAFIVVAAGWVGIYFAMMFET